jgi:hypothetical protein
LREQQTRIESAGQKGWGKHFNQAKHGPTNIREAGGVAK